MTPTEIVLDNYTLPFKLMPFQVEVVNDLAPRREEGHYLEPGLGKTLVSTVCALYHKWDYKNFGHHTTVVIMPPILLRQWQNWLAKIQPTLKVVRYSGTPAERKALSLDADFVLVGVQIFKKEFDRFLGYFAKREVTVIIDEATMVSNTGTDNHEKLHSFCSGRNKLMLTGTPMNSPGDAYGLLKFVCPGAYRNRAQFDRIHVKDRDFFGNVTEWENLESLAETMKINSQRVLLADVYDQMPKVSYIPLAYDLDPKHLKLYRKLADEELLKLPDGGKIDATQATKLIHALGQIVANWGHFAGDPDLVSETIHLVREKLGELGDGNLLVFAHYRMTVALLKEKLADYGVVTVNSEVTAKQKEKNIEIFTNNPKCRVMVAQVKSAGYGLDGLQMVCNHAMYVEPCTMPRDFSQSVARLARMGQDKSVQVYMAVAAGTLQPRAFNNLLDKDEVVNKVIRNVGDLREMIFGG